MGAIAAQTRASLLGARARLLQRAKGQSLMLGLGAATRLATGLLAGDGTEP